jgi:hypothetical protein
LDQYEDFFRAPVIQTYLFLLSNKYINSSQ